MTISIAVVGAGHMGALHAEKVAALRDADQAVALAGIADIDAVKASELASKFGTHAYTDNSLLLAAADAAIVAVPTVEHFEVVQEALNAGCDVLVEKPIAADLIEATGLLELAETRGRILQVGHLEWFNAAIATLSDRIHSPRFIEIVRVGPFQGRATDTDVVRDLMIHDLDIVQQLLDQEPLRIEAVGVKVLTEKVDLASARLEFGGGCVSNLTASRVSRLPKREFQLFQSDTCLSLDLINQTASITRAFGSDSSEVRTETIDVEPRDALMGQLRSFVSAIETRKPPRVDGANGLGALRTALRVLDAMESPEPSR